MVSDPFFKIFSSVLSQDQWRVLEAAYTVPPRAYHNFEHVLAVLQHYDEVAREGPGWLRPVETYLAILYHDVIYEPGSIDNERRSALFAQSHLTVLCTDKRDAVKALDIERVAELILLTADHGKWIGSDLDQDAALFLDCDMAILGASSERFECYNQQIAEEYASCVVEEAFRAGRSAFAQLLLARDRIFLSDFFHDRYEEAARSNLQRLLVA